uniref:Uncharacterized protein n=1 Tax=Triticum urartu TaxID=4572 RepID=A0A8R7QKY1_TRIUA
MAQNLWRLFSLPRSSSTLSSPSTPPSSIFCRIHPPNPSALEPSVRHLSIWTTWGCATMP